MLMLEPTAYGFVEFESPDVCSPMLLHIARFDAILGCENCTGDVQRKGLFV